MKNHSGSNTVVASISKANKERSPETQGGSSFVKKRLFTLREAAEFLGRSVWSMRELIWSGSIPVVKPEGARKIFLDIEDLDDFINRNKSTYL
jgi:excisionase family DNA binding protein